MGYSAYPSKNAGDDITATLWGTYIKANGEYLFNGRPYVNDRYLGSALTGTTTSWAAVSTTNARMTATINSGRVRGQFEFPFKLSSSSAGIAWVWFDVAVDGVRLGDSTLGLVVAPTEGDGNLRTVVVPFIATGVAVGNRNFDLYWKLKTSTST